MTVHGGQAKPAACPPVRPRMDFIELRHLIPLVVIGGSFTFVGTVLYGAWLLGRYRGREERTPLALADLEARLARLEHVVGQSTDALERLEAAHRLTARLLTDSVGERRAPTTRVTTPH
jgi:hypothetical protein